VKAAGLLFTAAVLALSGCGQIDVSPEGDPARVLTGQVELGDSAALPADAVVTVRVVDASAGMPPRILGSQTIDRPGAAPIDFHVEYRAEDEILRRGLLVEVRVSYGGKVRYFNVNHYAVTFGNAADVHRITVDRAGP
jgi:uncharacterized lipoprotein YbaY